MCALFPFNPVLSNSPSLSLPPSCRIPSDDHYATNVPNNEDSTFVAPPPVEAYSGGPREEVGEKIKAKREDLLCTEQGRLQTNTHTTYTPVCTVATSPSAFT